jgi:hypothetical protein
MNRIARTALVLAIFACASILLSIPARAQAVYGSLFGTVTDSSGAAVPNATITVKDVAKGTIVTVTSNASGDYSVPHLIPDVYDLRVGAEGFKVFETKGIQVLADTAPRIDPTLEVGATTDTVTVSADSQPLLKTDRADVATVFDQQQVSSLPVGDQNFTNLQLLLPGAQKLGWSHAADENPQGSQQIMVNGQAFAGTAFELDGTDNQDPILGIIVVNPTMDAVTETKITTQNFDAELGKAVSAVVTAQTRSGSTQFHGSVYDFRTSNANLARDPFTQAPDSIAGGIKNRIGGSLGGYIPLPKIKDRAFFFADYEAQRQRTGTTATSTLPTNLVVESCLGKNTTSAAQVAANTTGCDFSEYLTELSASGTIYDNSGSTPTEFSHNVIPATRLSDQAKAFLTYIEPYTTNVALGSGVGKLNGLDSNYNGSGTGGFNSDQWTVRGDYTLNEREHAFARFTRFTSTLTGKTAFGAAGGPGFGIGGFAGNSKGANDSLAAGMDIAFNPTLLADVRLGYYRYNVIDTKPDQNSTFADTLGIPGLNLGTFFTGGSPGFIFDTLSGGSTQPQYGDGLNINRCNCPLTEREDQGQVVTNWTKVLGNHSVKFGVDLRYARNLRVPSDNNRTGLLTFGAGPTSNGSAGGLGFATFLLGDVTQLQRYASTSTNAKEFQKRTFFYGQDTWRANRNLTINLGVRWELYFPEAVNGKGNGSLLNLDDGYLHVAGIGGIGTNMDSKAPKKNMFAPRIGVAYQMGPKTVIRAGYGRSFDIGIFGSIFGHTVTQNLPVLSNQQITQPSTTEAAFTLDVGPTAATTVTVPANGLLPNPGSLVNSRARPNPLRFPVIDAWNLAVQRALTPGLTLTVAYVGNKGTHTLGDGSGNTVDPNEAAIVLPGSLSKTGQALHYDPNATTADLTTTGATANPNTDLKRYYGSTLAACEDPNYSTPTGDSYITAGKCGWTNSITYYGDNLNTQFNALQVTLAQSMWKGFASTANYQWAAAFAPGTGYSTWSRSATRGRDSNVRRSQLTWYGSYDLPFGKGKQFATGANRITDLLIGGFQLSGVMNWAGGLPFSLSYNESKANVPSSCSTGCNAPSYPSYSGNAHMKTKLTSYVANGSGTGTRTYYAQQVDNLVSPGSVDTGVFTNPGLDTIGNVGRNTMVGPAFFNADLGLTKAFTIHENIVTKFRMDAFNAFNHINPGNPSGGIESTGTISSLAQGAQTRQLEFSLRVQF